MNLGQRIEDLVDHLKNGTDNRSGFMDKIDLTLRHARAIEHECERLRAENNDLERRFVGSALPSLAANWEGMYEPPHPSPVSGTIQIYEWFMEPLHWRVALRPHQHDEKNWLKFRALAYKHLLKRIRSLFEATYPKTPRGEQQPKMVVGSR